MSEITLEYTGKVQDGKLEIVHRKKMAEEVKAFEGNNVVITIKRKKKKRSTPQNAYYWGVVVPIVQQGLKDAGFQGMSKEKTHDFLKLEFLKDILVNEETGEAIGVIKSTTELSTSEFMDFLAEVQQWASEFLNVYIPDPNENL